MNPPGFVWTADGKSYSFRVKVLPRSSREGIVGVEQGLLKLRVGAPPVEGAANEAVRDLLSDWFDRPRSSITVVRGATSRIKTVRVEGLAKEKWQACLSEIEKGVL